MLTHPADPTLTLLELSDLDSLPSSAEPHAKALNLVVDWAREYLCRPHPDLGRKGQVCPFAQGSLDGGTFYLAVFPGRPEHLDEVTSLLLRYRDWFEQLKVGRERQAQFDTILTLFPDLDRAEVGRVVDATQDELKSEYVSRGLMIGEFHDGPPPKAGLWNDHFLPLNSPVPLLAIRHMVATDFPFLRDDAEHVAAYLANFGGKVPTHLRSHVQEAVERFGLVTDDADDAGAVGGRPLAPTQRRHWFLNQLDPGNPVQHLTRAWRLSGPVAAEALGARLDRLRARHSALRSTFGQVDGQPVAHTAAPTAIGLPVVTVAADDMARHLRAEVRRPFDLRRGPLLRGQLLTVSADDHVLVLTAHRLAVDEASLDRVARELLATEPIADEVDDNPYGRFALGQIQQLAEGQWAGSVQHWARRLADAPELLALPTDRPRPATQSYRGATHRFTLPAAAREELLAAFATVLARHSGQDEVVVGVPADARPADLAEAVGPFANSVAVRVSMAGEPSFRELTATVRTELATAPSEVPFEHLLEALDVPRATDRSPVFQAHLDARTTPPAVLPTARPMPVHAGGAPVDIALSTEPTAALSGELRATLEYGTDIFDADTIERISAQLSTLLTHALAHPDRSVHALPMLTDDEQRELLAHGRGVALSVPATVLDLLPPATDDPVLDADGTSLTRAELYERAAQLAHVLRAWGVGPGAPVGLCLDRSASMVVAMLGTWLAGAAYVPLDPAFPADRLRMMIDDAGVDVLVTDAVARRQQPDVTAACAGAICLTDDADVLRSQPATPPEVTVRGTDPAYVIYTSGSTGRPKGVEVPHRAVANLLASFTETLALDPMDRWLAVTTLSFDISVLELLLPLVAGARLVVAPADAVADGAALRRLAEASGATVMQATPATWRMLLTAGDVPPAIRLRLCGGEAVPRDLADALGTDGATLWNVYGPTETTVWSAAGIIAPSPAPIEIGPPIANTTLRVLDATGAPVPVGVVGELYIGGLGVATGYHNRPELTATRFVPDPFEDDPDARLYATGDLARWRPNGRLEFLGRTDHQVKVRGFRIELGEIESVLRDNSAVADAVVGTWTGEDDDTRLVAYVVARPGATADWPELRDRLREAVPEYMVPATMVPLEALPLTANGKVDRLALPEPQWGADDASEDGGTPPRNPIEAALAEMWCEVLGVSSASVTDNFFDRGGHSLLGAKLLSRIRAYFQLDLPMRSLFEAPTIAGLAAVLEELEPEPGRLLAIVELRAQIEAMASDEIRTVLEQS